MLRTLRGFLGKHSQSSPVFVFSFAILFWTIFDGMLSYITPLLMEEQGLSTSMIGLVIGSSSIVGALFDFIICKIFTNINFRRMFLIMFAVCFIYPLILWQATSVWMFLIAMAIWGIYYDLYGFGLFDFVGKYIKRANHSASFGIVQSFRALGGILAPFIIGLVAISYIDWRSFAVSWIFLVISFVLFMAFLLMMRGRKAVDGFKMVRPRRKNMFIEVHLWDKLGKLMSPVLFLTFYLFFIDAFFWTLAPLYAETVELEQFGGLFLAAYMIPQLVVGWFSGRLADRFGKKRSAYFGLMLGSLVLSTFFFITNPILSIAIVFVASCSISMAFPIISASYADYIDDAPQVEGEIEALEDFSVNLGYIFGPISAGFLAEIINIPAAFSILGISGTILAIILFFKSPKHVIIKTRASEI
jgi:MFS family permease